MEWREDRRAESTVVPAVFDTAGCEEPRRCSEDRGREGRLKRHHSTPPTLLSSTPVLFSSGELPASRDLPLGLDFTVPDAVDRVMEVHHLAAVRGVEFQLVADGQFAAFA